MACSQLHHHLKDGWPCWMDGPISALNHKPISRLQTKHDQLKLERGGGGVSVKGEGHHCCWPVLSNHQVTVKARWRSSRLLPPAPFTEHYQNQHKLQHQPAPPWSMSFTTDSSLNNHYSKLDMKWVDPTGPLIVGSIGDHKMAVSSP